MVVIGPRRLACDLVPSFGPRLSQLQFQQAGLVFTVAIANFLRNPDQKAAGNAYRVFRRWPKFVFIVRLDIPPESMLLG